MPKTCIANCSAVSVRECGTSFFRFPDKRSHPIQHDEWVRQVQRTRADWPGPSPKQSYIYLCSRHFVADCFENQLMNEFGIAVQRRNLKPDAIPTIFEASQFGNSHVEYIKAVRRAAGLVAPDSPAASLGTVSATGQIDNQVTCQDPGALTKTSPKCIDHTDCKPPSPQVFRNRRKSKRKPKTKSSTESKTVLVPSPRTNLKRVTSPKKESNDVTVAKMVEDLEDSKLNAEGTMPIDHVDSASDEDFSVDSNESPKKKSSQVRRRGPQKRISKGRVKMLKTWRKMQLSMKKTAQRVKKMNAELMAWPPDCTIRGDVLNGLFTCGVCHGYWVNATTITECMHTFCRSCILIHVDRSLHCPKCALLIHQSNPYLNLRPDGPLQEILNKVFPFLERDEAAREKKFYASRGLPLPTKEARAQGPAVWKPDSKSSIKRQLKRAIHFPVELLYVGSLPGVPVCKKVSKRFLWLPDCTTMGHIRQFISEEMKVPEGTQVGIFLDACLLHDSIRIRDLLGIFYESIDPEEFLLLQYGLLPDGQMLAEDYLPSVLKYDDSVSNAQETGERSAEGKECLDAKNEEDHISLSSASSDVDVSGSELEVRIVKDINTSACESAENSSESWSQPTLKNSVHIEQMSENQPSFPDEITDDSDSEESTSINDNSDSYNSDDSTDSSDDYDDDDDEDYVLGHVDGIM